MSDRRKSGAELAAEAECEAQRNVEPGAGMSAYNQAQAEARRRAEDARVEKVVIGVRTGQVQPQHMERIVLAPQPTRQRTPHAWSVIGFDRGDGDALAGVKVRCEHCGTETIVGLPGGFCET